MERERELVFGISPEHCSLGHHSLNYYGMASFKWEETCCRGGAGGKAHLAAASRGLKINLGGTACLTL